MVPKLSSNDYEFTIEQVVNPPSSTITVVQTTTGDIKVFFLAGEKKKEYLTNFMNSLTDLLCSTYFSKREIKKK